MNEQLEKLQIAYEALAIRERALILVAVLGASYGIMDMMFLHPMDLERDRLKAAIADSTTSAAHTTENIKALGVQIQNGKPTGLDDAADALQQQMSVMNAKIDERLSSMIRPDEVARMLDELLSKESDLQLIALTSVNAASAPKTSTNPDEAAEGEGSSNQNQGTRFYRHGFVIQLEGTYLATLHYLESIEGLPWDLSWDRISYEVDEYPRARISIELHTLSSEEDWIGV